MHQLLKFNMKLETKTKLQLCSRPCQPRFKSSSSADFGNDSTNDAIAFFHISQRPYRTSYDGSVFYQCESAMNCSGWHANETGLSPETSDNSQGALGSSSAVMD